MTLHRHAAHVLTRLIDETDCPDDDADATLVHAGLVARADGIVADAQRLLVAMRTNTDAWMASRITHAMFQEHENALLDAAEPEVITAVLEIMRDEKDVRS